MGKRLPKIIREEEGMLFEVPGGGYARRMIGTGISQKMCMGIVYVEKGKSVHRWHTHDEMDRSGDYEIIYPKGFEEEYLIVQGEGILQWKAERRIHEETLRTGDAVYFPTGVVEHQVINNSYKPLVVAYALSPPPKPRK